MERLIDEERRLRREYSTAFKASVLAQTREPGASVSGVALSHDLHPNMVLAFIFDGGRFHSRLMLAPFSWLPVPPHDESDWGYVAEKMTKGLRKCN
ncbi:transposase [Alicycliphilus denitrificans]|uniref:Transposase IS3/IS911 family protein n=1 Tax=Alicycliphilus denitrificans (strain DSM 14773 / CIP 107495 / K601) TaxID=596154 RepID=F4G9X0_ALIDK|nr:transposase [Alicycliphilus denitrificans]AEB85702.1 transposase IS3/IS911 family protein [Alicycliphilus denitrificans K601]